MAATTMDLLRAAEAGNASEVQRLLRQQVQPPPSPLRLHNSNNNDSLYRTALQVACRVGQESVVQLLLALLPPQQQQYNKHNDVINAASRGGWRPLHQACHGGHVEICRLLLQAGANPLARLVNGETPLHLACQQGHLGVVRLLTQQQQQQHKHHHHHHHHNNHAALVRALDKAGWTPLHTAAYHGHVDVVRYLVSQTPVHVHATCRRHGYTAFLLVAATPKRHEHRLTVMRALLAGGKADVNAVCDKGRSALQMAVERKDLPLVRFLLDVGATVQRQQLQLAKQWPDALYPLVKAATSQGFFA